MTALPKFLIGICMGVIVPLGIVLGWTFVSGEDPEVILHGSVSEAEATTILGVVEQTIDGHGRWVWSRTVQRAVDDIAWIEEVRVWRTITNGLHVDIIHTQSSASAMLAAEPSPVGYSESLESEPNETARGENGARVELQELKKEHSDVLDRMDLTSEGWRITLESGASVLLGNRDFEQRMRRFLAVHSVLVQVGDGMRIVADARYDHGVAVNWVDASEESPFGNDQEVSNSPVVITYD